MAGFEQTNLWKAIQKLIENDRLIGMLYSVKETSAKKSGINDETMKQHLVPQRDAHGKQCLTSAHFPITVSLTFTLWFEWVVITTGPMETTNYRARSYPASHSEPYVPLKQHLVAALLTLLRADKSYLPYNPRCGDPPRSYDSFTSRTSVCHGDPHGMTAKHVESGGPAWALGETKQKRTEHGSGRALLFWWLIEQHWQAQVGDNAERNQFK